MLILILLSGHKSHALLCPLASCNKQTNSTSKTDSVSETELEVVNGDHEGD